MGQPKSGTFGFGRPAEVGSWPGRAQFAHTKTVTAAWDRALAPSRLGVERGSIIGDLLGYRSHDNKTALLVNRILVEESLKIYLY
jgi:hypothetical protein